jgi:twitching motility protein PilT
LVSTPAVANLIREKRTHELPMLIETGTDHGMVDMNRVLIDLVQRDVIALGSAIEYSPNPNALRSQFK